MSRRELAEAVNAWLWETTRQRYELDAHTLARYERGAVCWPGAAHRSGLRHVLGTARDAELGFWPARQHPAPTQPRPAPIESVQDAAPVLLRNPACIKAHQEYQSPR